MMDHLILYLALNGVLILSISLIAGRWYAKAINNNHQSVAWRVVHSGGSMGGIMLIALTSIIPLITLSPFWQTVLVWSVISGTWLFILGMIIAAISGNRGLSASGNIKNRLIYLSYLSGSAFTFLACGLLTTGLIKSI